MADPERVYLKCFKDGAKLRVKIVSDGFNQDANCQFPRDIRAEGQLYSVVASQISIAARGGQKWFYRVSKPIIVETETFQFRVPRPLRVFEDTEMDECIVCLVSPKKFILVPCGHYSLCDECVRALNKCPLCRASIASKITKEQMD
jgi:C3HC4-type zinc finger (RING finger) protein